MDENTHPAPRLPDREVEIVENTAVDRFEMRLVDPEHTFVGFLGYTVDDQGVYDLQHTIIDEAFSRQGFARALVTYVLDDLRARNTRIVPTCTYVQGYLTRFPQYRSLVAG